jgi:hypothetical protein
MLHIDGDAIQDQEMLKINKVVKKKLAETWIGDKRRMNE